MAEQETRNLPPIPGKRFFTIGEAAELAGVAASVLRFWESEFKQLSPRRHGSRRRYEQKDILKAREIRSLLYDEGFTLAGARKILKQRTAKKPPAPSPEASSQRRRLIEELEDIRNSIKNFLL